MSSQTRTVTGLSSQAILSKARAEAARTKKFDSQATRQHMIDSVKDICAGKVPYNWQLDVSEAILLGLDTMLIAGTGAGKTLPFVMPLLLDKTGRSKIIIISPLNELQRDQVCLQPII